MDIWDRINNLPQEKQDQVIAWLGSSEYCTIQETIAYVDSIE